jgi:hypothetical protein
MSRKNLFWATFRRFFLDPEDLKLYNFLYYQAKLDINFYAGEGVNVYY